MRGSTWSRTRTRAGAFARLLRTHLKVLEGEEDKARLVVPAGVIEALGLEERRADRCPPAALAAGEDLHFEQGAEERTAASTSERKLYSFGAWITPVDGPGPMTTGSSPAAA